jgi:hypothetical protein
VLIIPNGFIKYCLHYSECARPALVTWRGLKFFA